MANIDRTDQAILDILQDDARTPVTAISQAVGLVPSAVMARIDKLEGKSRERDRASDVGDGPGSDRARGRGRSAAREPVILGYEARLDPTQLDLGLLAFVFVRADEGVGEPKAGQLLAAIPEVQEVHHVAGEDCYLVKVRAASPEALGQLLRTRFGAIAGVRSTRTTIVLHTIKETGRLPLCGEKATESDERIDRDTRA
ncbi:MAG TPA: Lrp/AsnC family transcriptional regulator [Ktedonobacterales bacterium]|jgi:Lrp/AsnC family leucine-responsive transcriptional regulator|nr:Lrp/AsnC family transcriptional regulator [Ktedonobacterales bacterium]